MKISVLYFAQLREIFGSQKSLEAPDGLCVEEVLERLEAGKLAEGKWPLVYAVNENFENADKILKDGDCLAVMIPVSGG